MFTDDMTLAEARAELRELVDAGHECPCCRQLAKVYRRKIHARMACGLILMYRAGGATQYVHAPTVTRSGDSMEVSKLRYWSLIEEERAVRPDGGRTGWWHLTPLGVRFVTGGVRLPKYARLYDGRSLGLDPSELVSIHDALGDKFNYTELMEGR